MIDLGFSPWTALAEGLLREPVERKSNKRRPVADYIKDRDRANALSNPDNEPNWEQWLQHWRVELNAMTTAQFVAWMNAQFLKHAAAKVIPSEQLALSSVSATITATLLAAAQAEVTQEHSEELEQLRQQLQNLETKIEKAAQKLADERFREIKLPTGSAAVEKVKVWLKKHDHQHWRNSIGEVAAKFMSKIR